MKSIFGGDSRIGINSKKSLEDKTEFWLIRSEILQNHDHAMSRSSSGIQQVGQVGGASHLESWHLTHMALPVP